MFASRPIHQLRPLETVEMEPQCDSEYARHRQFLQQLQAVRVVNSTKRDGQKFYMINVYFKHQNSCISRLPTNQLAVSPVAADIENRKPDMQVEHTHEEFERLLSNLYHEAHDAHDGSLCASCTKIVDFAILRKPLPSDLSLVFRKNTSAYRLLTKFLQESIDLVASTIAKDRDMCPGKLLCPKVLYDFFVPV